MYRPIRRRELDTKQVSRSVHPTLTDPGICSAAVTETGGPWEANPAPGDTLGPWRLKELIGEGGMGLVFRALHVETGAVAALKLIKPQLARDEEHRRRFVREARAAREVRHRHLVGVMDAGESDGRAWLALEFVAGRSLAARLRDEGPLPATDVVRMAAQ